MNLRCIRHETYSQGNGLRNLRDFFFSILIFLEKKKKNNCKFLLSWKRQKCRLCAGGNVIEDKNDFHDYATCHPSSVCSAHTHTQKQDILVDTRASKITRPDCNCNVWSCPLYDAVCFVASCVASGFSYVNGKK